MKIKLKNKIIDCVECKTAFSRFRGLMFRRKSKPILFVFDKPMRQAIHSFFCKPFLAVWLDDKNQITEKKIVKPFRGYIKPKKPFYNLLEIPINKKYQEKILTIVGKRKI